MCKIEYSSLYTVTVVKIDLKPALVCGICGKRVGSNAVCCTQCTKWIHGRDARK